jgi:hypothetical protein
LTFLFRKHKNIFLKKACAAWPNGMQHRFDRGFARNPYLFPTYRDTKNLNPLNISVLNLEKKKLCAIKE